MAFILTYNLILKIADPVMPFKLISHTSHRTDQYVISHLNTLFNNNDKTVLKEIQSLNHIFFNECKSQKKKKSINQ